ncbi:hypothetical protein MHY1_00406 [Methylovirgula sp. HY1]|nr:hypothetical protein MHY1_00406 [Methylovirgula sp. HY1]
MKPSASRCHGNLLTDSEGDVWSKLRGNLSQRLLQLRYCNATALIIYSYQCSRRSTTMTLAHVAEKLIDFSILSDIGYIRCLIDENMLQLIDFERFLLGRMSPSCREAL